MSKNIISHTEIPVTDLKLCKDFYEKLFDWKIDIENFPNYGFAPLIETSSVGFYLRKTKVRSPAVRPVVEVTDIEKTLKQVEKLGGKRKSAKMEIAPGMGFAAEFTDIFGNTIGLHSMS